MASDLPELAPPGASHELQLRQYLARINWYLNDKNAEPIAAEKLLTLCRGELASVWTPLHHLEQELPVLRRPPDPWQLMRQHMARLQSDQDRANTVMQLATLLDEAIVAARDKTLEVLLSLWNDGGRGQRAQVLVYERKQLAGYIPRLAEDIHDREPDDEP